MQSRIKAAEEDRIKLMDVTRTLSSNFLWLEGGELTAHVVYFTHRFDLDKTRAGSAVINGMRLRLSTSERAL
jgi:hypothetical protein